MNTDRFSSRQELEFDKVAFEAGVECRVAFGIETSDGARRNNPYFDECDPGRSMLSWKYRSFMAGWADADFGIKVDEDALR